MRQTLVCCILTVLGGCLPSLETACDCPESGYVCVAGVCLPDGDGAPVDTGAADTGAADARPRDAEPHPPRRDAGPEDATPPVEDAAPVDGALPDALRADDAAPAADAAPDGQTPDAEPDAADPDAADPDAADPDAADPDAEPDQGLPCPGLPEACNGRDDDCDGTIDEDTAQRCGPVALDGVGLCRAGLRICRDGALGGCEGAVEPAEEICDGLDNDCDGVADDQLDCRCMPDIEQDCYSGPAGTAGVGPCRTGRQTCNRQGTGFGPCAGEVMPVAETCNGADDDCNGVIDDVIEAGLPCTAGLGQCRQVGETACDPQTGGVICDAVEGPAADEVCNGLDDDCDGLADEGLRNACGDCAPEPPEVCNGEDDDCDGEIDEGAAVTCPARPHMVARCDAGQCAYDCADRRFDVDGLPANGCERGCGPVLIGGDRIGEGGTDFGIALRADGTPTSVIQTRPETLVIRRPPFQRVEEVALRTWDKPSIAENGAGSANAARGLLAATRELSLGRVFNGAYFRVSFDFNDLGIPDVVSTPANAGQLFTAAVVGQRLLGGAGAELSSSLYLTRFTAGQVPPAPAAVANTADAMLSHAGALVGLGVLPLPDGFGVAGWVSTEHGPALRFIRFDADGRERARYLQLLPWHEPTGRIRIVNRGNKVLIAAASQDGNTTISWPDLSEVTFFRGANERSLNLDVPGLAASPEGFLLVGRRRQDGHAVVYLLDDDGQAVTPAPLPLTMDPVQLPRPLIGPNGNLWLAWTDGDTVQLGDTGCR